MHDSNDAQAGRAAWSVVRARESPDSRPQMMCGTLVPVRFMIAFTESNFLFCPAHAKSEFII
jgi:hypothetical protein